MVVLTVLDFEDGLVYQYHIETDKENKPENNEFYISNITTKITTDFEEINQKYLKKLGSKGLSNRIDLINIIER